MTGRVTVVSGIDTGIGKSVATGLLARALLLRGVSTMTLKAVQTGSKGLSEDIALHRRLMGIAPLELDRQGVTCPFSFPFPASPHLAARLAGRRVEPGTIEAAARRLAESYEAVLLEGAGGVLVPLADTLLFADWVAGTGWPLVLVTSSRLGSINHTLLSLEACRSRGITLGGIIYNRFGEADRVIGDDTLALLTGQLCSMGLHAPVVELREGAFAPAAAGALLDALASPPEPQFPRHGP